MSESQYLAQVLQQGAGAAPAAQQFPAITPQQTQMMLHQKQAWEAANPGQNYFAHAAGQMGQNLMGAPGRVADAVGNLGQVPGQALTGLQQLAQRFGSQQLPGPPTPPPMPGDPSNQPIY